MFITKIRQLKYFVILFVVSFIFSSFFMLYFDSSLTKDAAQYDLIGWNISQGNGFSASASAPFLPTMYREPVYPYFLAAVYGIFGHNYPAVLVLQAILFIVVCFLTYLIAREIFDEKIARYAGLFTALCPTLANYVSNILSEIIFVFLICMSMLFLIKAVKSCKSIWFVLSAIVLAIGVMAKVVMLMFIVPVFFGIVFLVYTGRIDVKMAVKNFVMFILLFALVISPWVLRNKKIFDTYGITLRQGIALATRADRINDSFYLMKKNFVYNISEFLGRRFFPETVSLQDSNFIMQGSAKANTRFIELTKEYGYSEVGADRIMKQEAIGYIKKRPFKYMAQSLLEFEKLAMFLNIPALNEVYVRISAKSSFKLCFIGAVRGFLKVLSLIILALAIFGVYVSRGRWHLWIFIFFLIVYLNLINSMIFGDPRYAMPLIPFYIIFAVVGCFSLCRDSRYE